MGTVGVDAGADVAVVAAPDAGSSSEPDASDAGSVGVDAASAFVWYCYANVTSLTGPSGQFCNPAGLVTVSCGAAPATTAATCPTTDADPCPMVNNEGSGSACSIGFSNGATQAGFVGYPCVGGACPMGGTTTSYGPTQVCVCND